MFIFKTKKHLKMDDYMIGQTVECVRDGVYFEAKIVGILRDGNLNPIDVAVRNIDGVTYHIQPTRNPTRTNKSVKTKRL